SHRDAGCAIRKTKELGDFRGNGSLWIAPEIPADYGGAWTGGRWAHILRVTFSYLQRAPHGRTSRDADRRTTDRRLGPFRPEGDRGLPARRTRRRQRRQRPRRDRRGDDRGRRGDSRHRPLGAQVHRLERNLAAGLAG